MPKTGAPVYQIGSESGLAVNLEECAGCGIDGWGWRDDAWGAVGATSKTTFRFPAGGRQRLVVQVREDGVSVSEIRLSARRVQHNASRAGVHPRSSEKGAIAPTPEPRTCCVTVKESRRVAHHVEVRASTLFEPGPAAVAAFRHQSWGGRALTPNATIRIEVQLPPIVHAVPLKQSSGG